VELFLLPLDLARWDQTPGGDLMLVPVWSDVRPLRGAAGLVDWRLNGHLSNRLREERFRGTRGERLLLPTRRLTWRTILALGLGPRAEFDDDRFREALDTAFKVVRGLGLPTMALALPGREIGKLEPDRAATLFRESLAADGHRANHLASLTLVDTAAALKVMGELLGLTAASRARAAAR
jgi:cytosol aminopeptidase family protein